MSIDLTKFNLYTPLGKTISTKDLQTYSDQFFWHNADGSVTYDAPSFGEDITHTENSTYPRSELRETLTDGSVKSANWKLSDKSLRVIYQDFKVECLPKSGKAIIGQIHGEKSENPPFKFQITNNAIYAQLRRKFKGSEDKPVIISNYSLQTRIELKAFFYANGAMKIFRNIGQGWEQVVTDILLEDGYVFDMNSYDTAGDTWYYKVGVYSQNNIYPNDPSQGRGRATYWTHEIQHLDQVPQYEPGKEPLARTLQDVSADVSATLIHWKDGTLSKEDALVSLTTSKTESDTFPDTQERSDVYVLIENSVAEVSYIPPDDYQLAQMRIDELEALYRTGLKALQTDIKTQLNILTTDMKSLTDKTRTAPMYTEITAFKNDMKNGLIVTTEVV